ncbi:uncharacterized protein [Musca autumnalis]|uniref:uncharacterized protein n=1 Tax=Musca autumnalis TaxID=221902 RepID=UPI003CF2937F
MKLFLSVAIIVIFSSQISAFLPIHSADYGGENGLTRRNSFLSELEISLTETKHQFLTFLDNITQNLLDIFSVDTNQQEEPVTTIKPATTNEQSTTTSRPPSPTAEPVTTIKPAKTNEQSTTTSRPPSPAAVDSTTMSPLPSSTTKIPLSTTISIESTTPIAEP